MTRYLVDAANRAAVERIVAMRAPADCAIVDSTDGFNATTECVLIADQMADFDPLLNEARALDATVRTATAAGEMRRHTPILAPAHERCAPKAKDEFMGALVTRLYEHVTEPEIRRNKATLFLMHGPSGVGKTCGIALVAALLNKPRGRTCRLFAVRPGEFNAENGRKCTKKQRAAAETDDDGDDDERGYDDDEPEPIVAAAAATPEKTTGLEAIDQPIDIATIGGEMRVAITAAAEHCRCVRTGQLPAEAIFLLCIEDLQDVVGTAAAKSIIDGITAVARLAVAHPRNISLVASCDSQYARAPAVQTLTLNKDTLPFALQFQSVPALQAWQISRRIRAGFPELSEARADEIGARANGNMWTALHMAQFGVTATSLDFIDHRAVCKQLYTLVSTAAEFTAHKWTPRRAIAFASAKAAATYEGDRQRRQSLVERLAAVSTDLPFVDDAMRANFAALLPEPPPKPAEKDKDKEPKAITLLRMQIELTNLEAMGGALDCLSHADRYEQQRRQSGFAGRDGQDVDKAIYDALSVIAPCLAMAVHGRLGTPNRRMPAHDPRVPSTNPFEFKSVKARDARELAERNTELLVQVRPQLELLTQRPADGALLLSRDAAWAAANPPAGRPARRNGVQHSIGTVEMLFRFAAQGALALEACRLVGLDKETALRVVEFGRCMLIDRPTMDDLRTEYTALAKAKPDAFAPRIAESQTVGAPLPKDNGPVVTLKRRAKGEEIPGKRKRAKASVPAPTKLVQSTLGFARKPSNLIV
jgi:hypothetical protein